jgi:hypothetical protein
MTAAPAFADKAIAEILELSAELQIKKRATAQGSLAFRNFSVAIATYGKVLEVLTTLQHREEYAADLSLFSTMENLQGTRAIL